jgi:hypothetical protein
LLHWAGSGGAYEAGFQGTHPVETDASAVAAAESLGLFLSDALGVDLPIRVVLVVLGTIWAFRQGMARGMVAVTAVFFVLAVASTFLNGIPLVHQFFAATYPWSVPYRFFTFAAVPLAVIGGGGCVWLVTTWGSWLGRVRGAIARRRLGRVARVLVVTWVLLSTWALIAFLSISAEVETSFTNDDDAAMAWLRQHAEPGGVLASDPFADAGIWAPYKAGVPILIYRTVSDPATAAQRDLVLANIGRLEQEPAAAAAACALNVRYVYDGAAKSAWQQVHAFPPLDQLRAAPGLQEVFSQGDTVVFRTRQSCGQ